MSEQPRKTFKTTREILEMAESVHRRLKTAYAESKFEVEDARVSMLMDYIDQKEKNIKSIVSRCLNSTGQDVLETYYQFAPDLLKDLDAIEDWRPEENAEVKEVLEMVLQWDARMHEFYRRAAEMAPDETVRDMFENMADAVDAKKRDEVRNALRAKDF